MKWFTEFACRMAHWLGTPIAFGLSILIVAAWAAAGPLFGWSDTHQLIINTGTTIVTFWMVFLVQATQNRDGAAVQAKLDELIRSSQARNDFLEIDRKPEEEIEAMRGQ
jgi:low affinity Fe/Cu permease